MLDSLPIQSFLNTAPNLQSLTCIGLTLGDALYQSVLVPASQLAGMSLIHAIEMRNQSETPYLISQGLKTLHLTLDDCEDRRLSWPRDNLLFAQLRCLKFAAGQVEDEYLDCLLYILAGTPSLATLELDVLGIEFYVGAAHSQALSDKFQEISGPLTDLVLHRDGWPGLAKAFTQLTRLEVLVLNADKPIDCVESCLHLLPQKCLIKQISMRGASLWDQFPGSPPSDGASTRGKDSQAVLSFILCIWFAFVFLNLLRAFYEPLR